MGWHGLLMKRHGPISYLEPLTEAGSATRRRRHFQVGTAPKMDGLTLSRTSCYFCTIGLLSVLPPEQQMPESAEPLAYQFDDFLLDRAAGVLLRRQPGGAMTRVQLGSRAFQVLSLLVERR